ncbi:MOG interacting and ectopic P-granules protein 1 [Toxocara canis]|uniref:MOG interacting and ectopic P-granules protein 1 n=1 Tax=Toxocara canis TaxID=6265 RepID=A0A0B2UT63_TOXCA|nr:MOG interacting and ectopic P-granules protein 1 [Toxocara canis]
MVSSGDETTPKCSPTGRSEETRKALSEDVIRTDDVKTLKEAQQSISDNGPLKNVCDKVIEPLKNGLHAEHTDLKDENMEVTRGNGVEITCNEMASVGSNGYGVAAAESSSAMNTVLRNGVESDKSEMVGEQTSAAQSHSGGAEVSASTNSSEQIECIELDDGDGGVGAPPAKKMKCDGEASEKGEQESPIPDDPQTESAPKKPELTSSEALLNKLEAYVKEAIETDINVERKVLDALLGAINIQVQREPLSVRKLILEKQLVLPNTISFPPSQVVDLLIEHDPDAPLSKVITRLFGEERPKLTEAEKRDRHLLKMSHPAPHMTKLLMDIGQDLVQESTYSDIVHAKNLPETPKNMETYKQVAQQLKPVWEALRKKNEPYKLKQYTCQLCSFKTESRVVLALHRQTPHFDGRKHQCALCPEYFTNENMIIQHYARQHELVAGKEEPIPKNPCPCCDEDFMYKGQRDQHLKTCRRDLNRVRLIMAPKAPQDVSAINQWLWEKPPVDPAILQQQQVAQRQQAEKQQRAQLAQQQQLQQQQQRRTQAVAHNPALLTAQQQQAVFILQQQRIRAAQAQAAALSQQHAKMSNIMNNPSLLAAVQQQLQRAAAAGIRTPGIPPLFGVRLPTNNIRGALMPSGSALGNRLKPLLQVPTPRTPTSSAVASSSHSSANVCEICDQNVQDKDRYLTHLQLFHKQMRGKSSSDMQQGAPLACSRCRDRFWTYEGLERHLVMAHGLVTSDLLTKAQKKEDGGRCKLCGKQYAFNMLQHLVTDHQVKLCSAEIMYSCDVCAFKCSSYNKLEVHLNTVHPKNPTHSAALSNNVTVPSPDASGHRPTGVHYTGNDEEVVVLSDESPSPSARIRLSPSSSCASLASDASIGAQTSAARKTVAGGGGQPSTTVRDGTRQPLLARRPGAYVGQPQHRYNCTKCSVAFETIVDVIEHWQQYHLTPMRVGLCKIDRCQVHLSELRERHNLKVNLQMPERLDTDKEADTITLDDD